MKRLDDVGTGREHTGAMFLILINEMAECTVLEKFIKLYVSSGIVYVSTAKLI